METPSSVCSSVSFLREDAPPFIPPQKLPGSGTGSQHTGRELVLNDPPWPGHTYIIRFEDTSRVITYDKDKGILLAEYDGEPSQKWICHAKEGWLGFTNDPGESTLFIGHYNNKKLHCWVSHHLPGEMFCIRKRLGNGFQVLARVGGSLHPVGVDEAGDPAVVRHSKVWWGFTLIT
ncbi:hypothetical protein TWF730_005432 [Orbilia blumenaviensis]|uniref:Uncharacterized protein n=1 Tax=Orbilia blumenaviensis TaxID=1796055 RepID=A0AAV9VJJ2_9PEZI